jgi:hypothetical protein
MCDVTFWKLWYVLFGNIYRKEWISEGANSFFIKKLGQTGAHPLVSFTCILECLSLKFVHAILMSGATNKHDIYNTSEICFWDLKLRFKSCFQGLSSCNQTSVKPGRNPSEYEETNLSADIWKRSAVSRISPRYQTTISIHQKETVTQAQKHARRSANPEHATSPYWNINKSWRFHNSGDSYCGRLGYDTVHSCRCKSSVRSNVFLSIN